MKRTSIRRDDETVPKRAPEARGVLVVDDHSVVRHGLALLIGREDDLSILGEAATYEEALEALERTPPDVMLADLTLKDRSGLDLIREARERYPDLKILVLSMHDELTHAEKALRAGALGYVMKEQADETLVEALRAVLRGEVYVSPEVSAQMVRRVAEGDGPATIDPVDTLTEREREVFECIGRGLSSKAIADKLTLSERTVEVHRSHIRQKIGCDGIGQLLREAVRWVERKDGAS